MRSSDRISVIAALTIIVFAHDFGPVAAQDLDDYPPPPSLVSPIEGAIDFHVHSGQRLSDPRRTRRGTPQERAHHRAVEPPGDRPASGKSAMTRSRA